MARSLASDLLFLYKNFGKKHQFYELTVQKPFDQFQCKFDFVQLERVFFAHEKALSPNPSNMSRRFPHGLVIFCTGDLFFLYVNFGKKHHIHEPTIQKPFDQFRCKFDFVQLEGV